jgi:hypothetical protein
VLATVGAQRLPAGFPDARNLAFEGKLAEADSADAKLAEIPALPAAQLAPVVLANGTGVSGKLLQLDPLFLLFEPPPLLLVFLVESLPLLFTGNPAFLGHIVGV